MDASTDLDQLNSQQLRELAVRLIAEVRTKQTLIDKLTHEMATLKRLKFAATSEAYAGEKQQLLFETINTDLAALSAEIEQRTSEPSVRGEKQQPKRSPLPSHLARTEIRQEPASTACSCG